MSSQVDIYFGNDHGGAWPNKVPFMELKVGQVFRWTPPETLDVNIALALCIKTSRQHYLCYPEVGEPEQLELDNTELGALTDPLPMQIRTS